MKTDAGGVHTQKQKNKRPAKHWRNVRYLKGIKVNEKNAKSSYFAMLNWDTVASPPSSLASVMGESPALRLSSAIRTRDA